MSTQLACLTGANAAAEVQEGKAKSRSGMRLRRGQLCGRALLGSDDAWTGIAFSNTVPATVISLGCIGGFSV